MALRRQLWVQLASLALLLAAWQIVSGIVDSRALPGPGLVLVSLRAELASGDLLYHLGATLARVAAAFVLAMAVGCAIGIAMGRITVLDRALDGWLILLLNVPALVIIILAYVWMGLTEAAAVGAVMVNKVPNVVVTMREGARALDRDLLDMAAAFRLGRWRTLRHVVWPQLTPFIMASARSGLALIWKIVLVAELLGRSSGVGFQLQMFFQLFDVAGILAYTIAFVLIVLAIELALLQPFERRINRWRR